jgi:hypothetical protein
MEGLPVIREELVAATADRFPQVDSSGFADFEFLGKNTLNIPPLAIYSLSNGEKAVEALVI